MSQHHQFVTVTEPVRKKQQKTIVHKGRTQGAGHKIQTTVDKGEGRSKNSHFCGRPLVSIENKGGTI